MPITSIIFGVLLIIIGAVGYVHGVMNDKGSITALIPAFFGIVIALLGLAAQTKESLRMHLMHAAVLVGLVGFLASAGRLASKFSDISMTPAYIAQIAMAVTCLLYVIFAVRSFIAARRARTA